VKGDGPLRNTQDVGGLSRGSSFWEKSDDFSLTRRAAFALWIVNDHGPIIVGVLVASYWQT
jgi:hypothetical protein